MISRLVHTQIFVLRLLQTTETKKSSDKTATIKQIRALCEIILNVFKGIDPLSEYHVKKNYNKAVLFNKKKKSFATTTEYSSSVVKGSISYYRSPWQRR